ncbi:MAG: DUF2493 domain-containing protein [Chitinophagaceae bacterium]|nr:DUF2493 domain-containing protein [Oligoflexus sp.]
MKIIVCGSQNYQNQSLLSNALREYTRRHKVSTIVIGTEPGAETMTAEWAMQNGVRLSIIPTDRKVPREHALIERNKRLIATHHDAKAVLHFVGSEGSEDLCLRALGSNIVVDDVVGPAHS